MTDMGLWHRRPGRQDHVRVHVWHLPGLLHQESCRHKAAHDCPGILPEGTEAYRIGSPFPRALPEGGPGKTYFICPACWRRWDLKPLGGWGTPEIYRTGPQPQSRGIRMPHGVWG